MSPINQASVVTPFMGPGRTEPDKSGNYRAVKEKERRHDGAEGEARG